MIYLLIAIAILIALALSFVHKRRTRAELIAIFQEYNRQEDIGILIEWIETKKTSQRLTVVLDFLRDIEEPKLAVEVLQSFDLNNLQHRHILIFAAQAYLAAKDPKALVLGDLLLERFPGDDTALDTYVDIQLTVGSLEKAKDKLLPRLQRKHKGTMFTRHYARICAREGDLDKAISLMEQVAKRDYVLFQNTFATPQKGQIRKQFEESQALLDSLREQREAKATD